MLADSAGVQEPLTDRGFGEQEGDIVEEGPLVLLDGEQIVPACLAHLATQRPLAIECITAHQAAREPHALQQMWRHAQLRFLVGVYLVCGGRRLLRAGPDPRLRQH